MKILLRFGEGISHGIYINWGLEENDETDKNTRCIGINRKEIKSEVPVMIFRGLVSE